MCLAEKILPDFIFDCLGIQWHFRCLKGQYHVLSDIVTVFFIVEQLMNIIVRIRDAVHHSEMLPKVFTSCEPVKAQKIRSCIAIAF